MPHIFLYIKYFITENACLQGFRANSPENLQRIYAIVRIYSRSILYLLALANLCAVKAVVCYFILHGNAIDRNQTAVCE